MIGQVLLCVENERQAVGYCDALVHAGLPASRLTVLVPPAKPAGLRELAASAAGLVLAGGPDIHPRHYGEEPMDGAGLEIDEPLDELELELLAGAEAGRTPVWAICRGMQTVNVFLGGTLFQDLTLQLAGAARHHFKVPLDHPAHPLERIVDETPFGQALGRHSSAVNSRHHQAVKNLAPGLRPVAWAPDGVLESFERVTGGQWLRAVQWHPENLTALPVQLDLWRDFVETAQAPPRAGGGEAR